MDIHTALLADSATVREGLLHLLGAPITRIYPPALPASLNTTLVLIFDLAPQDLGVPHEIEVNITGPDNEAVAHVVGESDQKSRPSSNLASTFSLRWSFPSRESV